MLGTFLDRVQTTCLRFGRYWRKTGRGYANGRESVLKNQQAGVERGAFRGLPTTTRLPMRVSVVFWGGGRWGL